MTDATQPSAHNTSLHHLTQTSLLHPLGLVRKKFGHVSVGNDGQLKMSLTGPRLFRGRQVTQMRQAEAQEKNNAARTAFADKLRETYGEEIGNLLETEVTEKNGKPLELREVKLLLSKAEQEQKIDALTDAAWTEAELDKYLDCIVDLAMSPGRRGDQEAAHFRTDQFHNLGLGETPSREEVADALQTRMDAYKLRTREHVRNDLVNLGEEKAKANLERRFKRLDAHFSMMFSKADPAVAHDDPHNLGAFDFKDPDSAMFRLFPTDSLRVETALQILDGHLKLSFFEIQEYMEPRVHGQDQRHLAETEGVSPKE